MGMKKAGFTLIELLVVVLIIGILVAAALPQYRVAVQKTRIMSLLPVLRAISDAENMYFLEHGEYTLSFDNLSISMPEGGELVEDSSGLNMLVYKKFQCYIMPTMTSAYCFENATKNEIRLEKYFNQKEYVCWAKTESVFEKVCQNISGIAEKRSPLSNGFVSYRF